MLDIRSDQSPIRGIKPSLCNLIFVPEAEAWAYRINGSAIVINSPVGKG